MSRCAYLRIERIRHDEWINLLLGESPEPFWLCDPDIVFHGPVEGFAEPGVLMKGRYEPPFLEPWSKTRKVERLHTSLLYMDAPTLRVKIRSWMRRWHPENFPFRPMAALVHQCYIPDGSRRRRCSRTPAPNYRALGGTAFTDEENAAYDHLHCGSYVEKMKEAVPGLADAHKRIYQNPALAKSLKSEQQSFYSKRAYANRYANSSVVATKLGTSWILRPNSVDSSKVPARCRKRADPIETTATGFAESINSVSYRASSNRQ